MTTFFYTITSNTVQVTDGTAIADLLSDYQADILFSVSPEFDEEAETLYFSREDAYTPFEIECPDSRDNDSTRYCTEDFLQELAPFLEQSLTIKTVQTEGYGELYVGKWCVDPDGTVTHHTF